MLLDSADAKLEVATRPTLDLDLLMKLSRSRVDCSVVGNKVNFSSLAGF